MRARIAVFTETFLPHTDGVVTTLLRTLDELRARGYEAMVFAPAHGSTHRAVEHYRDVPVRRVASMPLKPWYPELDVALPSAAIDRDLRDFDPDVVLALSPVWLSAYGVMRAHALGYPVVASYNTDIPQYMSVLGLQALRPAATRWLRTVHNLADANLCPSRPLVLEARVRGIERVGWWPGAVDTELFHPGRATRAMRARLSGGRPDRPLILSVGRLSPEKNLAALEEPLRRLGGARIAFVGTGPAEDDLRERFASLGATFPGVLRGRELAEAYASADVFAFPSLTDTLGLVSLEALASGVPVVGARAGGIPDTIRHGETGLLVDPRDPAAFEDGLTEALGSLLDDAARRLSMGIAAREDALGRSWSAATDGLVAVLQRAIARRAATAGGRAPTSIAA